jgi:hypothetical protein
VPKGDGGLRRIHDLSYPRGSSVNELTPDAYKAITYTTIADICDSILAAGRGCTIVKRDIKDAFRNVPIAPSEQWLVGFEWEGAYYQEACLPFGLGTAPFIFNLFAEGLHWILQRAIHPAFTYYFLDDFILIIPRAIPAQQACSIWTSTTTLLGVPRSDPKDRQGQIVDILGIELDTIKFEARLSSEKLASAARLTEELLQQKSVSLLRMQEVAGYLAFCAQVTRYGRAFTASIWRFIASFHGVKGLRHIPATVRADLLWWHTILPRFNGVLFFDDQSRPVFRLFTDACPRGMGGFFYKGLTNSWAEHITAIQYNHMFAMPIAGVELRLPHPYIPAIPFAGVEPQLPHPYMLVMPFAGVEPQLPHPYMPVMPFAGVEPQLPQPYMPAMPFAGAEHQLPQLYINTLEMDAVLVAFQAWSHLWAGSTVYINTDNEAVRFAIQNSSTKGAASVALRELFLIASQQDIKLVPAWLSSSDNALADALSRLDLNRIANLCPHIQSLPSLPAR